MVTLQHILPMDMKTTLLVSRDAFRRATKFGLFPRPGYTLAVHLCWATSLFHLQ